MNGPAGAQRDPALLELFQAEMDTHIPTLSEGLLALEKGQVGEQDIAAMMRAAHSIKGAARIVGIEAAVRIAHVMEDCFQAAKAGRVALCGAAVDTLLQGVDALQRICAPQTDPDQTEPWLTGLCERIAAVRDGWAVSGAAAPPSSLAPPEGAAAPQGRGAHEGARVVLPLDVDDAEAEHLRVQLCQALEAAPATVRLDFSQAKRLSAAALALLAAFSREADRATIAVAPEGVCEPIGTLLRVAGLDRAWPQRP